MTKRLPNITKRDLVRELAIYAGGLRLEDARNYVEIIMKTIIDCLKEPNSSVMIKGFGKFTHVIRRQRVARNMRTGEQVIVPERSRIKWKCLIDFNR